MNKTKWEKIGQIGVDAGLCWIGDPCYILHKEEEGITHRVLDLYRPGVS